MFKKIKEHNFEYLEKELQEQNDSFEYLKSNNKSVQYYWDKNYDSEKFKFVNRKNISEI